MSNESRVFGKVYRTEVSSVWPMSYYEELHHTVPPLFVPRDMAI